MQLHAHVCWWLSPALTRAGGMFLVKPLRQVSWRHDGQTYRGTGTTPVEVRVCAHRANSAHPSIGETFLAEPKHLIAVQHGAGHN